MGWLSRSSALARGGFGDHFEWKPERGSKLLVVTRPEADHVAEGVSRASAQFAQAAEVAKKAMGQMFDMLQARNKS